jgi:hypothetical protein
VICSVIWKSSTNSLFRYEIMYLIIRIGRGTQVFFAFIIVDVKNIEQEVDLVLSCILVQVLELRNSFVLERLPVKFATKLEQDILHL